MNTPFQRRTLVVLVGDVITETFSEEGLSVEKADELKTLVDEIVYDKRHARDPV